MKLTFHLFHRRATPRALHKRRQSVSRRRDHAEETIGIRVGSGSKEQEVVGSRHGTAVARASVMAELDSPEVIDLDDFSVSIAKRTKKSSRSIEGVHSPPRSIIADQNGITHSAEVGGSLSNTPRRVQRAVDCEVLSQGSVSIENIYKAALGFV